MALRGIKLLPNGTSRLPAVVAPVRALVEPFVWTAEWIARQLVETCGWDKAPRYLVHDRDRSYGEVFLPACSRHRTSEIDRPRPDRRGKTDMRSG